MLLYGAAEACVLKDDTANGLEVFEIWMHRRTPPLPWIAMETNEAVICP